MEIPIKDQNLKEETLAIIALLNLQYWCKDEREKKRLQIIYAQNEKEYQNKLYEKYNPNSIFKNKQIIEENESTDLPIEIKSKNLFVKLIDCLKKKFLRIIK